MNDISTNDKNVNNIKWKYNIDEIVSNDKANFLILDKEIKPRQTYNKNNGNYYTTKDKYYKYQCLKCGYIDWKLESNLKKRNCACCSGRIPVKGINTLGDIRPDLIKYFVNPDDAFKITKGVKNKQNLICPICKHQKQMTVSHLVERGFSCPKCDDNISYPEKFMMSLLDQLKIKYIYQLSKKHFKWCKNFKYDFYLPDYNCIIETNGIQHYGKPIHKNQSYDEILSADLEKKAEAISNGIAFYEWIDCAISSSEYIVNSILESKMCEILHFSFDDIDLKQCEYIASKSILKDICDCYSQNHKITLYKMEDIFQLSRQTIRKYLKRGNTIGLCDYRVNKSKRDNTKPSKNISGKPVEIIDDQKYSIGICNSAVSTSKFLNDTFGISIHPVTIRNICREQREKPCKGYAFKYITKEEYESRPQDHRDLSEEEIDV